MKDIMKNKRGAFTDLFLFIIVTFIILLISGLFIYMGVTVYTELGDELEGKEVGDNVNYTQIVDASMGDLVATYEMLYWISIFIIVAMIISIFVGSYYITTQPVFFIPYIFIVLIAIVISATISNAYGSIAITSELSSTFAGFKGSNHIMAYLPTWVAVIGFVGGIIMFVRMKQEELSPFG